MLEHRAAGLLKPDWIGSEVVFQAGPPGGQTTTYTGTLSDYEVADVGVTLWVDGIIIGVKHSTSITRGTLDLPGRA